MKVAIEFFTDGGYYDGIIKTTLPASEVMGAEVPLAKDAHVHGVPGKHSVKEGTLLRVIKAWRCPSSAYPDMENWVHVQVVLA